MSDVWWLIPCRSCHDTFCLYEGERLPRPDEVVKVAALRDLTGKPVDLTAEAKCYSCGAPISGSIPLPLDWVRRVEP